MSQTTEYVCCVCDHGCHSAANYQEKRALRARCFACGEAVCTNCSGRRKYPLHGIKRICNNCFEK